MNEWVCDSVSPGTEPDFVDPPDDSLQKIRTEIRKSIKAQTTVMNTDLDPELIKCAETKPAQNGWTAEEACILFLY